MSSNTSATLESLVVVDLASLSFARPAVRWMAARVVRDELRRSRAGGCRVLLQAEDDEPLRQSLGGIVIRPIDVLTPELLAEGHRWVDHTSKEMVFGRGRSLFPDALGVSLGELNLLPIQGYLNDFVQVAGSMRALLDGHGVRRCRIVTGDAERSESLRAAASQFVAEVTAWSPPLMGPLRRIGYLVRDAADAWRRRGGAEETPAANPFADPVLPAKVRILTVSESVPMAQMFGAVERHLSERECGGPLVRVQFGPGARQIQRDSDTTVLRLGRPLTVPARRRGRFAARWYSKVAPAVRALDVRAPFRGAELRAPLSPVLEHIYLDLFDQQLEHLEYAKSIIDAARPDMLVAGNDRWWVGQAFTQLARVAGVPTFCVQDGLAGNNPYWWWVTVDRFAAVSDMLARAMERGGVPAHKLAVTGQPRYDFLHAKREMSREQARGDLGLEQGACYALFATQPHQTVDYVRSVVDAVLAVPGVRVLLRPHPSEPEGKYREVVRAHPADRISGQGGRDIFLLLIAADMLVTEWSTVALEAAALGRPTISAVFSGLPTVVQYGEAGVAISAKTPAEVTEAVRRLAAGGPAVRAEVERQGRAAEDLLGVVDGRAGERAARLILAALQSIATGPVGAGAPATPVTRSDDRPSQTGGAVRARR